MIPQATQSGPAAVGEIKRPVLILETDPLDVPRTDDEIIESIRAAEFEERAAAVCDHPPAMRKEADVNRILRIIEEIDREGGEG